MNLIPGCFPTGGILGALGAAVGFGFAALKSAGYTSTPPSP
ncbi:hypothetical protein ACIRP2_01740 [Streptomyces sp. NPDC101194]